jgi:hypothetical protein
MIRVIPFVIGAVRHKAKEIEDIEREIEYQKNNPTPTPTPTITSTISVTPSVTRTPSISITPSVTRTPSITPTPTPLPATINWSLSEFSDPSTFIDANFKIIRVSDGAVYIDQLTGGNGSFQVAADTQIQLYLYSFTNTPPSYWNIYESATMTGRLYWNGLYIIDTSRTLNPNSGTQDITSNNITVSAGGTYTLTVTSHSPIVPSPSTSVTPTPTPTPTPTTASSNPPYGTYLYTSCSGSYRTFYYADGDGGSYAGFTYLSYYHCGY